MLDFKSNIRPNYWFYALYLGEEYPLNRNQMIQYLSTKKIQVRPIWGLISDQKPYEGSRTYQIEKAKRYLAKVVNISCSSNLTNEDVLTVIDCLKQP